MSNSSDRIRRLAVLASLLTLAPGVLTYARADGVWTVSTGFDYSSGRYGEAAHSEMLTVPFGVKYEASPWTLRLTIPYVEVQGPSNVVASGGDPITLQRAGATHRVARGMGDVVLGGAWTAFQQDGWLLDLGGKVKFATGNASQGLSTGKNDYSLQADVYRKLGIGTVFATLGKRKMGDPEGVNLADPAYGTLGWSMPLAVGMSGGATYDYRQKLQPSGAPVRELTVFVTHRFDEAWKIQGYVVSGYSPASPDLGGGLLLFYSPR